MTETIHSKSKWMIQIIDGNKVPLYKQVARRMMQRIRTGEYREGALLPPIRAISRQFGVSVTVVQQALRDMEQHGLVKARHGKGVLVIGSQAADRAALVFGMVHPYAQGMSFGRDVLHFATQAFGQRKNLLIPVSSEGDAAREREQVEHHPLACPGR
jgi:DNA-binding transcriptional regulator YhcF (GntR family)